MPASAVCQVKDGGGPWVDTTNGVNVTSGNTISIRLKDSAGVTDWYAYLRGTDEEIGTLVLVGVDPVTGRAPTPTSVVTFDMPASFGHAVTMESKIRTLGGTFISTKCGIYILTSQGLRVGAVGETREADPNFGWAHTVNEAIRNIGHGGGGSGEDLERTVVAGESVSAYIPVALGTDGRFYRADAGVANRSNVRGFSKTIGTAGNTFLIVTDGAFTYAPGGLTPGMPIYLAVGGGFSYSPPSRDIPNLYVASLGSTIDTNTILIDVDMIAET